MATNMTVRGHDRKEYIVSDHIALISGIESDYVPGNDISAAQGDELTPPILPEGKIFHVFLSHNSEPDERAYALNIMDILEGPKYKMKCCFADRDFRVGKAIMVSIEERLQESMFAVFLLTPNFLGSRFCEHEHILAQQLIYDKEQNFRIIPILLKDCELPRRLECITYIDAREKSPLEVIKEQNGLLDAILTEEYWEDKRTGGTMRQQTYVGSRATNGSYIEIKGHGFPSDTEDELLLSKFTLNEREECNQMELQFTDNDYADLITVLKKTPIVVHHDSAAWNEIFKVLLSLIFLMNSFIYPFWFMIFWALDWDDYVLITSGVIYHPIILTILISVAIIPLYIYIIRRKIHPASEDYFGLISQHSCPGKGFMLCLGSYIPPTFWLIRYSVGSCKSYIVEHLLGREEEVNDVDPSFSKEEIADEIIQRAIPGYLAVLQQGTNVAAQHRHPVRRNLICLCQFIEIQNLHMLHVMECQPETDRLFPRLRTTRARVDDRQALLI